MAAAAAAAAVLCCVAWQQQGAGLQRNGGEATREGVQQADELGQYSSGD
jgi:hypothetical protein